MEHTGGTNQILGDTAVTGAGGRARHTRRRRWPAVVAALAALAAAGCGGSASQPGAGNPLSTPQTAPAVTNENSGTGLQSGVTGGALFGGNVALLPEESQVGRRLAIVRDYYRFGESFPNYMDSRIMASGSTLVVSLDIPRGGTPYAVTASGQNDAYFSGFLHAVNQAAIRYHLPAIYFSFEHESGAPGKHAGLGSPAQFVQAWDHIHALAASEHLNWNDGGRIHWVWIQTHTLFTPLDERPRSQLNVGLPAAYWPGRNEVDIVGVDGYNHTGCSRHAIGATPESLFGPALRFAHQNGGLPLFITEWGSTAFPSSQWQTGFIHQMQAFVTANREIAAALYWNSPGQGLHCDFSVNAHPGSVSALATMAHSAALQGRSG